MLNVITGSTKNLSKNENIVKEMSFKENKNKNILKKIMALATSS